MSLIRFILLPFAFIYSKIIWIRNYFFDKGIFTVKKVNAKVISIGNLTVGGSGKTPAVIYVTNKLKDAGKKVGILSRGYRRNTDGYLLVSDGINITKKVIECGDEMYLLANETGVPAAVSEKRVEGSERLIADTGINTIVLDDAFQHRWLKRDLDILMFDQRFLGKFGSMEQQLIPSGRMREPFNSVKRADIILINRKFSEQENIPLKLKPYFEGKRIFYAYYKATGIHDVKTHQEYNLTEFGGQKSLVICGIARPYSFLNILSSNNINIENKILFTDHKEYSQKEVNEIRKKFYDTNSYSVLTTQKDAVKLINYSKELDDIDIYYLKIELKIEDESQFDNCLFDIYK